MQQLTHTELREAMVRWIDEDVMPHIRKVCMAWLDEDLTPQVHAEAKRLGFHTETMWRPQPCPPKPCPPKGPPPAHLLKKAMPTQAKHPAAKKSNGQGNAKRPSTCEAVDLPDVKKVRGSVSKVPMGEAPRVKKGAPFCKMKAKPPEHAKPVALGPCSQDDEKEADEDDMQDNQAADELGAGGHGSSISSRGQGKAAPGNADTGSTVDAQDDDHTQGDMQAALHNTMSRDAIKQDLQTIIKTNYHVLFKAQVAPRILDAMVSFKQGKERQACGQRGAQQT